MASRVEIRESEIIDEIRASMAVEERKPGFFSVNEMAAELECNPTTIQRRLRKMGNRVESMRVKDRRGDGQPQVITVYRLKRK